MPALFSDIRPLAPRWAVSCRCGRISEIDAKGIAARHPRATVAAVRRAFWCWYCRGKTTPLLVGKLAPPRQIDPIEAYGQAHGFSTAPRGHKERRAESMIAVCVAEALRLRDERGK